LLLHSIAGLPQALLLALLQLLRRMLLLLDCRHTLHRSWHFPLLLLLLRPGWLPLLQFLQLHPVLRVQAVRARLLRGWHSSWHCSCSCSCSWVEFWLWLRLELLRVI
jgi:hypothetical protein